MEVPTSNRKKVIDILLTGLVAKNDLFPFFGRSYLGNRSTYIAENFHRICLGIICKCAKPNFIEIGGVTRKPLVDLARNDLQTMPMTIA